ncbi:MAG TPA: phytoene/squalene synthase family protein [Rhizomicrobium sp.]|nr:phytoene/squalene synthase family protein [Rhizomicrobium sp.]
MSDPHETIEQTVRRVDPDRYFSALFAPAAARRHLLTLYAFNHEIARVAETVRQPMMGEIKLEWWRETLEGARSGSPRDHALARALTELFAAYRLPVNLFDAILTARAFDSTPDLFANWAEVENYCDQTSGNIMRLAAQILGGAEAGDAIAREAGTAYAIAGLIRSLRFHAARHKVYLPQDLLGAVGLLPDQIMAGKFDEKVKAAIAQTILKAAEHFHAARLLVPPRALLPAFLPAALVPLYLRRAKRRSFDPLKHSGDVAQHRKQLALLRAALRRRL